MKYSIERQKLSPKPNRIVDKFFSVQEKNSDILMRRYYNVKYANYFKIFLQAHFDNLGYG
ncbi:MAG: hypothetical protein ACJAYF_002993 [Arenicella sp.]|jgi:hypothetical protein